MSAVAVLWKSSAKTKQEAEQKSAVAGGGKSEQEREREKESRDGAKSHVEYSSLNTNVFQPL